MEEIAYLLKDLGLTAKQVKFFLALNKIGLASAKDLATFTKAYRQESYQVLFELQKLGLVDKKIGMPNKFKTVSVSEALEILLRRKNEWITTMQEKTFKAIKNYELKLNNEPKSENYDITLICGYERFGKALSDWITNAKTIDMVLLFDSFSYQVGERLNLSNVSYRNDVRIRVVTCAPPESINVKEWEGRNVKIRYVQFLTPVDIAIYDGNRAHLAIYSNRISTIDSEVSALTSNNPCYVNMLQNYFDVLWNIAEKGR